MENSDSKIIDKILKLLALGKENPNENEAQAAILKAHELMAEFGIDSISEEEQKISYAKEFCEHRGNRQFRKLLSGVIAESFRCKNYYINGQVVFFGRENDARVAKEVFEYAYSFAYRESNRLKAKHRREKGYGSGIINSYAIGFIRGLHEKLAQQCVALMIVTPPDVKNQYDDMSKDWKTDHTRLLVVNGINAEAYDQGVTDGRTIMNGRRLAG